MKVIFVDDEQSAHINFQYDVKNRMEITSVTYFLDGEKALAYAQNHPLDCAFLDIDMPGIGGLELAKQMKEAQPHMEIIFISAHDEYARNAYKVGAKAYLSKPYTEEEFDTTIKMLLKLTVGHHLEEAVKPAAEEKSELNRISAKSFGDFDLLVNQRPVLFQNAKAKELLAFLIDRRGSTATNAQIFMALWERQEYSRVTSTYVRRTIRSLKMDLEKAGVEHILITHRNCVSVDVTQFQCDYYDLMHGDMAAARHYNGAYMSQYSWSEVTVPLIERAFLSMMSMG